MPLFYDRLGSPSLRRSITRGGLVVLALAALWVGLNAANLRQLYRATQQRRAEEQKLRVARKTVAELEKRRQLLARSEFENEKRIRSSLMLKPGERVIYLKPSPGEK